MSHGIALLQIIYNKAKLNWIDPVDPVKHPDKWNEAWFNHVLNTARQYKLELQNDGKSVKEIERVIAFIKGCL